MEKRNWKYWITPQLPPSDESRLSVDEAYLAVEKLLTWCFEFLKRLVVVAALGALAAASKLQWVQTAYLVAIVLLGLWTTLWPMRMLTKLDDALPKSGPAFSLVTLLLVAIALGISIALFLSLREALTAMVGTFPVRG